VTEVSLPFPPELVEEIAKRAAELVQQEPERWLSQKELAAHFGCSIRTVSNYHRAGMPHIMVGSHPRYRASECEAFLTARSGRAYDGGWFNQSGAATAGNDPAP
jgi:hypothetical protein